MANRRQTTAAWRISIGSTVAFAIGTALAFLIVYLLVSQTIRRRTDQWLTGEAVVLSRVARNSRQDNLYNRIVREVAELATQEVPDGQTPNGQKQNSVFFLLEPKDHSTPLWVGPDSQAAFINAIHGANFVGKGPQSIRVQGFEKRFRVVCQDDNDRMVYLGLSVRGNARLLNGLILRFLLLWGGTVALGFVISYWSARSTLRRVERITETVARIDSDDFAVRLPEPVNADEIARLAQTFNRMLDRVQTSVSQLRSVTDAVAHDVKSPVTSIRGTLEAALSDRSQEHWRDSVAESIEGLDRLLQLLNTVLDLAEAQAGALQLDRKPVDLTETVRKLVELYYPAMANNLLEVKTELEPHVTVEADLPLLSRMISNLLENEMTHLPAGCEIWVRLRSDGDQVELIVEDNGPGFPAEIAERACERFVKGKNSTGHGLGLAFVDAVVHAHNGAIQITARQGGGAAVVLSFPAHVLQPATRGEQIR